MISAVAMQMNMSIAVDAVSSTLIATILTFLLIKIVRYVFRNKNIPPGPRGLPYFGYWPFIKNDGCHLQLNSLRKQYGNIFSFTCTGRLYINLGSSKIVREAFKTKSEFFGDRASGYSVMNCFFKDGVIAINGDPWRVARKFFLVLLKERGANSLKTSLAGPLYDSIKCTMSDLRSRNGEPLNLIDFLLHECCTILRMTLFGEVGVTEEQLRKFNELYAAEITCMTPRSVLLRGTFAKYFIFPFMPNFSKALMCHKKIETLVQDIINEHKENYDPENPRDIIDEYFKERDRRRNRGDHSAKYFTDEVLIGSLVQFMGDGALLIATFTSLLMSGMLLFPEEQDKLYNEIVEVIGLDRQPTIEDKTRLTYFNAYVQESTRKTDGFTFFPNQECTKETTVGGYRIPKGAILIQNFYSCHNDPDVYKDPEKFDPSRYIPVGGKRKAEPPILFGFVYFVKDRGLPPGPVGLPYFGYWPFMNNSNPHFKLDRLKKKHGDVFCFSCTGRLYINLGSYKAVREALVTKSECFGERMSGYHLFGHVFRGGVIYINGEAWKVARKFFLVVIKERGANSFKTSIAVPLYESIQSSVNDLRARKGKPLNLIEFCTHRCNAFLRFTMFGEIGATAEEINKFSELFSVAVQCITPTNMLLCGTFAKHFILPFTPYYNETVKCHDKMEKLVYDIIDRHKATYDSENPRNIIDEYFKERDKRRSKGDPTADYFTDETLMGTLSQFMGDGVLIASSFSCMLMKNFLLHPEEQEKLYREVVDVVGVQRLPTIEDKSKLSYFNAYILESMRTSDFFTYFPSQECTKETTLSGYKIPKGAVVIENFYSCHHDPKVYDEPEKFDPSRFLQTDGKRRPEQPILFGMGKRACLGESYVMIQCFLMLATLIQNFHLSLPKGTYVSVESFLNSNLMVCATPRIH